MVHHVHISAGTGVEPDVVWAEGVACDSLLEAIFKALDAVTTVLISLGLIKPVVKLGTVAVLIRVLANSGILWDTDQIGALASSGS